MATTMAEAIRSADRVRETCGGCRFWQQRGEGNSKGECRRYPPTTVPGRLTPPPTAHPNWRPFPEHYFPMTMHDQWCGEFEGD